MNVPSNESSLLTSDESMEVENGKNLLTDDDDDDDDFQPLKKTARKATEILDKVRFCNTQVTRIEAQQLRNICCILTLHTRANGNAFSPSLNTFTCS